MKCRRCLVILLVFVLNVGLSMGGGTEDPLDFLNVNVSARGIALGGAYLTLVEDATSILWNPAGLGKIRSLSAGFHMIDDFDVKGDRFMSLGVPIRKAGLTIGLGWRTNQIENIFNRPSNAFYLGIGKEVVENEMYVGGTLLLLNSDQKSMQGNGMRFSLGMVYRISDKFSFGMKVDDNFSVEWSNNGDSNPESDSNHENKQEIAYRGMTGIGFKPFRFLNLLLDLEKIETVPILIHGGIEITPPLSQWMPNVPILKDFALRFGAINADYPGLGRVNHLSLGGGVNLAINNIRIMINVAWAEKGTGVSRNVYSLNVAF